MHVCTHMHARTHAHEHTHTYVCMYIHVCMCVCMCVCECVCVCVCVCVGIIKLENLAWFSCNSNQYFTTHTFYYICLNKDALTVAPSFTASVMVAIDIILMPTCASIKDVSYATVILSRGEWDSWVNRSGYYN